MPDRFPRLPNKTTSVSQSVIHELNKKYKKDRQEICLSTLEDSIFSTERPYAPTGIGPLDKALSGGKGFPSGIVELYGPESSGKTAVLEATIAACQRAGWFTILYPSEFSPNYDRMKRVGIDKRQLIVFQDAETIEDFFDQLKDTVRGIRKRDKITPILVGWDSIASTTTRRSQENKKGLAGSNMGDFAAAMSRFFNQLRGFLFKNNICLLAINQTRTNLGQMFGSPETTPGGKALRFYAWVRCRTSKLELIKDAAGIEIGQISLMEMRKNKFYPPFRKCKFHIYWSGEDVGISRTMTVWEYCIDNNLIKRKGTAYRYHGNVITRKSFPKFYSSHRKEIDQKILDTV